MNNNNQPGQIIFIYNAKSGFINAFFDYVHKLVSPSTYSCKLCSLTYNNLGEINKWSHYLRSLPYKTLFLYRDQLNKQQLDFNCNVESLPCLLFFNNDKHHLLISNNEINRLNSLEELIHLIEKRLP